MFARLITDRNNLNTMLFTAPGNNNIIIRAPTKYIFSCARIIPEGKRRLPRGKRVLLKYKRAATTAAAAPEDLPRIRFRERFPVVVFFFFSPPVPFGLAPIDYYLLLFFAVTLLFYSGVYIIMPSVRRA